MSIALERNNTADRQIERSGFVHGMAFIPIYKSADLRVQAKQENEDDRTSSSSSSSSIGRNSDDSPAVGGSSSDGGDGEEVQSPFKPAGALDNLEALEEVLPIKYVVLLLI